MKSFYRTTFVDGSFEDVEAENSGEAKIAAKNKRITEVDPGRKMQAADLSRHDRVKVVEVHERTSEETAAVDRSSR